MHRLMCATVATQVWLAVLCGFLPVTHRILDPSGPCFSSLLTLSIHERLLHGLEQQVLTFTYLRLLFR